jgi:hypothetical protein
MSRPKKTASPKRPIKILAYGDSPVVPSGFGTVMRNLFGILGKTGRYEIDLFGINDRGNWKDPARYPYHVYQALPPGETDPYGRSRFVDVLRGGGLDLQPPWDIIFFLNDPFVLENPIPFFNLGTLPATRTPAAEPTLEPTPYTTLTSKTETPPTPHIPWPLAIATGLSTLLGLRGMANHFRNRRSRSNQY